jgi:hypothetical protein
MKVIERGVAHLKKKNRFQYGTETNLPSHHVFFSDKGRFYYSKKQYIRPLYNQDAHNNSKRIHFAPLV